MEPIGITPKSGIWRASYRRSLIENILGCSETEAYASAMQLARWCGCIDHFERECRRVLEGVRLELHVRRTADDELRYAIMDNIVSMVKAAGFREAGLVLATAS